MTASSAIRSPWAAALLGAACLVVLLAAGSFVPEVVLRGWLIGFGTMGSIPLGCLALLAIHGLTGGRWGAAGRPALVAGASLLPVVLVLWIPLTLGAKSLYPWAADPQAAGPDVSHDYLNNGFFALRGLVVLGGLSVFAFLARRGPLATLVAALCLVLFGVGMNLSAYDWLLSLDPHNNGSAFGMQLIATQLAAALAFVILATPADREEPAWGDFGALLLAVLLGVLYLIFMTFLIDWYGDLPEQADWYLVRSRHGWLVLEIIGLAVGAIGPLLALLFGRTRHDPLRLKVVAGAVLIGVALEMIWLVAPGSGGWAALMGGVAALAFGALLRAAAAWLPSGRTAPLRFANER